MGHYFYLLGHFDCSICFEYLQSVGQVYVVHFGNKVISIGEYLFRIVSTWNSYLAVEKTIARTSHSLPASNER